MRTETAGKSFWWTHLSLSMWSATLLALALAHIDIFARLAAQKMQWYEPHLAILVPALLCLPIFMGIACYLHFTFWIRKSALSMASLQKFYALLCACILGLMLVSVLVFSFRLSEVRGELYSSQLLVLVGEPILVFLWIVLIWYSLCESRFKWAKSIRTFAQHYWLMLCCFTFGSVATDIYLLNRLPAYDNTVSSSQQPNVVLITLDTVRADHLTPYGYARDTTPNLQKLAEKSVLFERANSTTSWTLPSHASLFTGTNIETHGAHGLHQKLEDSNLTLAEILRSEGYRTAGFIGGGYCKAMYGLAQGFEHYSDRLDFFEFDHTYDFFSVRKLIDQASSNLRRTLFQNDGEKLAPEINREVADWLDCCGHSPFFIFINYFDAHAPYNLGREYRSEFVAQPNFTEELAIETVYNHQYDLRKRYAVSEVSAPLGEYIAGLYDSELRYLDRHVGNLIDLLEKRGLLKNTLLVVTSDHGEEFLDHGGFSHSLTLYQEMLHVPLLIHFPKSLSPKRIPDHVGIVDVLPTVLELLGIEKRVSTDGRSLLPLIQGEEQPSFPLFASLYPNAKKSYQRATILEGWKFLFADPEQPRVKTSLFDLQTDPNEKASKLDAYPRRAQRPDAHPAR